MNGALVVASVKLGGQLLDLSLVVAAGVGDGSGDFLRSWSWLGWARELDVLDSLLELDDLLLEGSDNSSENWSLRSWGSLDLLGHVSDLLSQFLDSVDQFLDDGVLGRS